MSDDMYLFKFNNGKHQTNIKNLFKVNDKDTRTISSWCLYYKRWTDFIHSSGVLILDFEQVNVDWISFLF